MENLYHSIKGDCDAVLFTEDQKQNIINNVESLNNSDFVLNINNLYVLWLDSLENWDKIYSYLNFNY